MTRPRVTNRTRAERSVIARAQRSVITRAQRSVTTNEGRCLGVGDEAELDRTATAGDALEGAEHVVQPGRVVERWKATGEQARDRLGGRHRCHLVGGGVAG